MLRALLMLALGLALGHPGLHWTAGLAGSHWDPDGSQGGLSSAPAKVGGLWDPNGADPNAGSRWDPDGSYPKVGNHWDPNG